MSHTSHVPGPQAAFPRLVVDNAPTRTALGGSQCPDQLWQGIKTSGRELSSQLLVETCPVRKVAVFPPIADSARPNVSQFRDGACTTKRVNDFTNGRKQIRLHKTYYSVQLNDVKCGNSESRPNGFGPSVGAMKRQIPLDSLEAVAMRLTAARKALRNPNGREKSQKDLCQTLHVQPNTWNQWERAIYLPDVLAMARLGDLYGISMDWIYRGRADTMPPDLAEAVSAVFDALLEKATSDDAAAAQ